MVERMVQPLTTQVAGGATTGHRRTPDTLPRQRAPCGTRRSTVEPGIGPDDKGSQCAVDQGGGGTILQAAAPTAPGTNSGKPRTEAAGGTVEGMVTALTEDGERGTADTAAHDHSGIIEAVGRGGGQALPVLGLTPDVEVMVSPQSHIVGTPRGAVGQYPDCRSRQQGPAQRAEWTRCLP